MQAKFNKPDQNIVFKMIDRDQTNPIMRKQICKA
jgi:hypothetical protein